MLVVARSVYRSSYMLVLSRSVYRGRGVSSDLTHLFIEVAMC